MSEALTLNSIPNIGGLGIIAGIYITTLSIGFILYDYKQVKFLIGLFIPLMILLFVGFKDDVVGLGANAKLFTELGTALVFILLTNFRIDSFYGLFGIHEIDYFLNLNSIGFCVCNNDKFL